MKPQRVKDFVTSLNWATLVHPQGQREKDGTVNLLEKTGTTFMKM